MAILGNLIQEITAANIANSTEEIVFSNQRVLAAHARRLRSEANVKSKKQDTILAIKRFFSWIRHISASAIILAILIFIIVNFYIFASLVNFNKFFYIFLILSLLTDGLYILVHLFRRETPHENISFDPSKVTAVIACYNGEDVIADTIKNCLKHLPPENIIVVSDASTDKTAEISRSYGVRVIENKRNLHKAQSVHEGVKQVRTPYALLLDDDVLIGDAVIPTSLLDEGYTAVAFNVMPIRGETLVNLLQMYEYRNSMNIGKSLRAQVGAVGNVSGAIGLYRTDNLLEQQTMHSGQFAGEDEQRTLLSHMYGKGKGVTYTTETVQTLAPATFYSLYRQRAYSWSLAVPELFWLYWRIILTPKYHYLLKAEKAYYLYIYLTDPLRMLFLWALILRPKQLLMTYAFYLVMNLLIWFKTKRKDHLFVVFLYPFYTLWLSLCRFIGNFYWLRVKAKYLRNKLHTNIKDRRLLAEYTLVFSVFLISWIVGGTHFINDMKVFNRIKDYKLENSEKPFLYDTSNLVTAADPMQLSRLKVLTIAPEPGTFISVPLQKGDTTRAIAYKAIMQLVASHPELNEPYNKLMFANNLLAQHFNENGVYVSPTSAVLVGTDIIQQSIEASRSST